MISPLAGSVTASASALERAARDFEAQALGSLLAPMFEGVPTDGPFGGGSAEAQWRPMLIQAIGQQMAQAGGVGLATAVLAELLRAQEIAARDHAPVSTSGLARLAMETTGEST